MASSRFSSNTPDLEDVTVTIAAFEKINQVRVSVRLGCVERDGRTDLRLIAEAWSLEGLFSEVRLLALVSVNCSGINLKSMDAALIHVLYMLDGKLAEEEFARVDKK